MQDILHWQMIMKYIALTPILRPRIGKFKVESVSLRYMP